MCPDFDDRVDGTDSPNRTPVSRTTVRTPVPQMPARHTPAGWTSVGTDTPQYPVSAVYAMHYGRDGDYTLIGLFVSLAAAEARLHADLRKYADLGFKDWPTTDGMPPEYPEIEQRVVHGAPPVMRGYANRGVVTRDRATGRLIGRNEDNLYYWDDTAELLSQDECDAAGLDTRDA
jgi:hypothetical protein